MATFDREQFKIDQATVIPPLEDCNLTGQTVIVTGANAGIGYEMAKYVLAKGAKVIAACRRVDASNEAIEELKKETGRTDIEVWQLDLASFASVKAFAKRYIESGMPLHVLYNNAGVNLPRHITSDGFEQSFQVNLLSTMLLTLLLWPVLQKHTGEPNRVVFTSSGGAYQVPNVQEASEPNPIEVLATTKQFEGRPEQSMHYFTSKLALYAISVELAKRGKGQVLISTGDPGLILNDFAARNENGDVLFKKTDKFMRELFGVEPRSSADGAKMMLMPGTYPVDKIWHDGHDTAPTFRTGKETVLPTIALDPAFQKKVWADTIRLIKVTPGEIGGISLN